MSRETRCIASTSSHSSSVVDEGGDDHRRRPDIPAAALRRPPHIAAAQRRRAAARRHVQQTVWRWRACGCPSGRHPAGARRVVLWRRCGRPALVQNLRQGACLGHEDDSGRQRPLWRGVDDDVAAQSIEDLPKGGDLRPRRVCHQRPRADSAGSSRSRGRCAPFGERRLAAREGLLRGGRAHRDPRPRGVRQVCRTRDAIPLKRVVRDRGEPRPRPARARKRYRASFIHLFIYFPAHLPTAVRSIGPSGCERRSTHGIGVLRCERLGS